VIELIFILNGREILAVSKIRKCVKEGGWHPLMYTSSTAPKIPESINVK